MDERNSIVLNNFDAKGRTIQHDFQKFKEVESCTLNRFQINDEIINKLNQMNHLKTMIFSHCVFNNEKKLENDVENLMMIYCKNVKFDTFFNSHKIKRIMFTKLENIDIKELKIFQNLEELSIFDCEIKNFSEIKSLKKLKKIKLDGSQIDNKETLSEIQDNINIEYNETYHVGF